MSVNGTNVVPGMAEAIAKRAAECGMTPTKFAQAAGLTGAGLDPVRRGIRKQYAPKTRIGVARALGWPHNWYELLLEGVDASTFPETDHPATTAQRLEAIERAMERLTALVAEQNLLVIEALASAREGAR